MNFLGSFSQRIAELPYLFVVLMFTFTLHEFSHAAVATWLGDNSPKTEGRLTLNPLRHIDPQGFLLMLLVGIGWTRPVDLRESNYRTDNDYILSVLAGPLMNFFLAVFGIFLLPLITWGMNGLLISLPEQTQTLIVVWNVSVHFLQLFIQVNVFFLISTFYPCLI